MFFARCSVSLSARNQPAANIGYVRMTFGRAGEGEIRQRG